MSERPSELGRSKPRVLASKRPTKVGRLFSQAWRYSRPEDLESNERALLLEAIEPHLSPGQLITVRARLLGPMEWMNHYAAQSRWRHSALRLIGVLASAATPALAGLSLRTATVVVGVIAAASLAVDQFLGFGDRWRHHRAVSEALKREGWLFVELRQSEPDADKNEAFAKFAQRVEHILSEHWATYLSVLAAERPTGGGQNQNSTS
jgi:Protein of unknown function (DUF4231)